MNVAPRFGDEGYEWVLLDAVNAGVITQREASERLDVHRAVEAAVAALRADEERPA